jgi:hypothetical protein
VTTAAFLAVAGRHNDDLREVKQEAKFDRFE